MLLLVVVGQPGQPNKESLEEVRVSQEELFNLVANGELIEIADEIADDTGEVRTVRSGFRFQNVHEIDSYSEMTESTAIYPGSNEGNGPALSYVGLGLVGEAGEIANKIKKILRDDDGVVRPEKRAELRKELGDVFWYVCRLCEELEIVPSEVLAENLNKLASRKDRGVIGGSGDNR